MSGSRTFGKIEYGFREALQKLSDSMKDASAIVGKWKDICTSDKPVVTLSMSDGDHEVMTLTGIKESLNDWINKTTGTLTRSRFKALITGGHYSELGGTYLTFANYKRYQMGGSTSSYRSLSAFADVADTYRLSFVKDTDYFSSMYALPKVLVISLGIKTVTVDGVNIHKVAIRSTPELGSLPDGRQEKPVAPLATEFFIHNDLLNPITVEFYSGADYSQKVASVVVPAHVRGELRTATHLICMGDAGAPVSIDRVV